MGQVMAIRENGRAFRKFDYGLENALAKWVRNRWPDKTIQHVAHWFGLSESAAAKVVYAEASKASINTILNHPRGGFKLGLILLEDMTKTKLRDYIIEEAEAARRDADELERMEALLSPGGNRLSEKRAFSR